MTMMIALGVVLNWQLTVKIVAVGLYSFLLVALIVYAWIDRRD